MTLRIMAEAMRCRCYSDVDPKARSMWTVKGIPLFTLPLGMVIMARWNSCYGFIPKARCG